MRYLAVTQKTADWILRSPNAKDALVQELPNLATTTSLKEGILAIGAIRACAHNLDVLCIWNTDYTSVRGVEEWGFILLDTQYGILANKEIMAEVFERSLFVINQRLQGLLLPDDRFIHRSLGDNIHCCLAGRGNYARQCSIGYVEGMYAYVDMEIRSILTIGPWGGSKDNLKSLVEKEAVHINDYVAASNDIISIAANRPAIDSTAFIGLRQHFLPQSAMRIETHDGIPVAEIPELDATVIAQDKVYETLKWSYEEWIEVSSPLSQAQRAILEGDIILKQPLRLIGAAGSGKTLLMQLLSIRRLEAAKSDDAQIRILYVVHNNEMADTVFNRFVTLGASKFLEKSAKQNLVVATLFGYSQERLGLSNTSVIDRDAYQTKMFQRNLIKECIAQVADHSKDKIARGSFLSCLIDERESQDVYADLIGTEIGVAIKGRDLGNDSRKYITSEKPLSRLHGALSQLERRFVFDVYQRYHEQLFEIYETLDADDVALSLLGHFRTPLWQMRRKTEGFDFVFVDETQLFNENERGLFHLLTKDDSDHLPVALALDEAQALHGAATSGFGIFGIENLSNQMLQSVYRCTESILKLAFYLLQRTTDLFTSDFPDFTRNTVTLVSNDHPLASKPYLSLQESQSIAKAVLREVRNLRKKNIRQVGVVVHSEKYWSDIVEYFSSSERQLAVMIQSKRGERIDPNKPIIIITRPDTVGGQEFDAVIAVGIEKGLVPPIVKNHSGLQTALEQQALREMYLSFTRARYLLIIVNSKHSVLSPIIQNAVSNGLIDA